MDTYNIFLEYYDKIVRGINSPLEDEVEFLNNLIKKYSQKETSSISILETACGTGTVAKEFEKLGYNIIGLDINPKMLEIAKKNLAEKNLVLGDMTNFSLQESFDVILCNYNSICHLLTWQEWQNFFKMSYNHLNKGGILIFDINTLYEFENITRDFSQFYTFGDDTVCLEMYKKTLFYEWIIKIFKKSPDGRYDLITENVKENSFPTEIIKKELKNKGFKVLEMIDFHYGEVNQESERVYFVCEKK
ncbi:MAG: methyltransferase domain-containing protein [Candidatus Gracilibacteria bacterium]